MLIEKKRIPVKDILLYGLWPRLLKNIIYRLKGYRIGKKVKIGFGSVIIGDEISIGDETTIGFFTIIRGKQINIGSHVSIGSITFIDTPYVKIGSGTKINEQVFVGGLQYPDSKFIVGRNCQIMQMCFINPAKSIVIGDDSGIGGDSLIFGHTSWLSKFEGYDVDFDDVEIGNSVSLAWRVFVLPGSKIGDGSVVGANSLVHRTIPPKSMAVGFPARVVRKQPDFPRELTREDKANILEHIIQDMLDFFLGHEIGCKRINDETLIVSRHKKSFFGQRTDSWRIHIIKQRLSETVPAEGGMECDVLISLEEIPFIFKQFCSRNQVFWIDIEKKEQADMDDVLGNEIVSFLKRYGVRLNRVVPEKS
jgi:acetyltransferase-like isoleucine patch superfamily enzyme